MATKQRGIMGKRKRQAGIARFANGTGAGTIGDAPQLQVIDPNSTQVQYAAPDKMSLQDAQEAMRGLYGEGQDYSGELEQLRQLQGNIRGNTFADRLADFGARLASSKSGLAGAYGEALGGSLKDGQLANQQALQSTTALMAARQRILQAQQARQDAMAGNSVNYAQQQNQDAVNAAKAQYQANVHNVDARTGAIMHNNQTDISQQEIEQRRLAMMSSEPEVSAMKQDALTKAAAETDPAKKADLLAKANQADQALQQIQALKKADLDQKNKATMELEDHQFAHQKELAGINAVNQQKLFGMKQGMRADGTYDPAYIKAISNYELDPPSPRDPAYKLIMAQVHQVNGDYRPEQMAVIKRARLGFTTGAQGDSARQLNNVIQHADIAYQMNDALHNGSFRPGTDVYNKVLNTFGSDAITNPQIVLHYLSSEAGKSLAGRTGGTQDERKAVSDIANMQSGSYDQIKGALGTTIRLVGSQARNLNEQYRQAVGPTRSGDSFSVIYPESREVLSRHGFDPETMASKGAALGGGYTKTATGPGGHKIGSKDGGATWFDVQTGKPVQ